VFLAGKLIEERKGNTEMMQVDPDLRPTALGFDEREAFECF